MKLRLKKPRTRDEFFELTRDWYGVGLTFSGYTMSNAGNYEIDQKESWYSGLPKPKERDKEYGQYDGLKQILDLTFGRLYCGGVAGSHYGQFEFTGYRNKLRLKKLYSSKLSSHYQETVHNYPR